MKLKTEEEIKVAADKASEDWHPCIKDIDLDEYFIITDAFYEGAEWMQQDLLSQASEGFEEWWREQNLLYPNLYSDAWQACSIAHAKMMQEKDAEIENLRKESARVIEVITNIHKRLRDNESELRVLADLEKLIESKGEAK